MSLTAALIDRLTATAATTGLKHIAGAAGFQRAVEQKPPALPAAFVLLQDEAAQPTPVAPGAIQHIRAHIGIVLVTRNVTDGRGAAASQDMEALSAAVRAQLMGWVPRAGSRALERTRSQLLAFADGCMYWQDSFDTVYFDRAP